MKIYRAIPESFLTKRKYENNYYGLENVYNENGYVSFSDNDNHVYNDYYATLDSAERKSGRYFFLFPEEAITKGFELLSSYHNFIFPYFLISEYDIPIDTIIKHIGTGRYGENEEINKCLECYIEKDDFTGDKFNTLNLSKEERLNFFVNSINNVTKRILDYPEEIRDSKAIDSFIEKMGGNLDKIVDNKEKIKEIILNNYSVSDNKVDRELIKTDYLTSKIIPVNIEYLDYYLGSFENIEKYYKEKGINVEYSDDRLKLKEEIKEALPDKDKVKKILLKLK